MEKHKRLDDVGENTHWDVFLFSPATHPQLHAFLFLLLSLSFFLSLILLLQGLQQESELRPNDSYDHGGREWLVYGKRVLAFFSR